MSDWVGVAIAAAALLLSGYTWFIQRRRQSIEDSRAHVTVALHWLSVRAKVTIAGKGQYEAGYHLVLTNGGPSAASDVDVQLTDADGRSLTLLDLDPGELPLRVLDADGRYPIPWLYEPFTPRERRFAATVSWKDGAGEHQREVPLRRGQLPS